ncbi:MAG TPA: hypothetical protein VKL22_00060, partial [Actinomycetota bacterium]|nr:hypothetical protein [Actinomycetota bacterium]
MTGYEEIERISGGAAVRARRLSDEATVVMKQLSAMGNLTWLARVVERARVLAGLDHPGLPRIFEVIADDEVATIVMEEAAGSLEQRL